MTQLGHTGAGLALKTIWIHRGIGDKRNGDVASGEYPLVI